MMNALATLVSFASHWFPYFVVAAVVLAVLYCFLKLLADDAGTEQGPIRRQDAR
ncbi:hypothetical protein BAE44_0017533 [Dichanthelium oligosanthes]|uniref:Uncharacterized protein n=1 Tax=Dichanthelium oligosanthes TaxID=888268 RepID=A0A1E5V8K2_9POAL|nr:hypothetical protein BAE44_0017533 [Dichanthelium oligosanthes]